MQEQYENNHCPPKVSVYLEILLTHEIEGSWPKENKNDSLYLKHTTYAFTLHNNLWARYHYWPYFAKEKALASVM